MEWLCAPVVALGGLSARGAMEDAVQVAYAALYETVDWLVCRRHILAPRERRNSEPSHVAFDAQWRQWQQRQQSSLLPELQWMSLRVEYAPAIQHGWARFLCMRRNEHALTVGAALGGSVEALLQATVVAHQESWFDGQSSHTLPMFCSALCSMMACFFDGAHVAVPWVYTYVTGVAARLPLSERNVRRVLLGAAFLAMKMLCEEYDCRTWVFAERTGLKPKDAARLQWCVYDYLDGRLLVSQDQWVQAADVVGARLPA